MNTADIIKKRREELGLSQEELAAKLGYKSRSSINKIELGLSDIPFSKIPLFAKALELEPEILMGWGKEKVNEKLEEVSKIHKEYSKAELKGEFTITENINDEYIRILNVENEKANETIYNLKRNEYDSKMIDKIKISFSLNDINYTDDDVYKFIKLFKEYKKLSDDKQKEVESIISGKYLKKIYKDIKDKDVEKSGIVSIAKKRKKKEFLSLQLIYDFYENNFVSQSRLIQKNATSKLNYIINKEVYFLVIPKDESSELKNTLKEEFPSAIIEKIESNNSLSDTMED